MIPSHLNTVLADARRDDLERAAGCCTPGRRHGAAERRTPRFRLLRRRPVAARCG